MTTENGTKFYIATDGNAANPGSFEAPFDSLFTAQKKVRQWLGENDGSVEVVLREGTYYLDRTLELGPDDSPRDGHRITYGAYQREKATISGGLRLSCQWEPYEKGIWKTPIAGKAASAGFAQLFVNGQRQVRARYPNRDDSDQRSFTGYIRAAGKIGENETSSSPDPNQDMTFSSGAPAGITFDPSTFTDKTWQHPEEAVIHIYQAHYWGNLQWRLRSIDWEKRQIWFGNGGQQMGAKWSLDPCEVNQRSFFYIENVFEELDAPGEWFYDPRASMLYYYPPADVDLKSAVIEVPVLQQAIRLVGTQNTPAQNITIKNLRFAHTKATYLEEYSIPSLSDWAIHRGGAVFFQGSRNCEITSCYFDAVGGNAVFMNNHNRGNTVSSCRFAGIGDSAICFVGSLETTVGTQRNFPFECVASNNKIHNCGAFGKQVAGVYISRAKRITASHNEIYATPRAGICIGDGTWGGHVIEYNYIHDTCRETGDHGPFNAWGRDKYWCLVQSHLEYLAERNHDAGEVKVDAMETVIMRYNYFKEDSGWGLDLDDGASNYEIYNNLCVGISMKLREGAYRTIYNNIWVNGANSPCFHVGNEDNHDRYMRNITVMSVKNMVPENDLNFDMGAGYGEIYTLIAPPARTPWMEEVDYNCFYSDTGEFSARVTERIKGSEKDRRQNRSADGRKIDLAEWRAMGFDKNSVFANPLFIDPKNGDYRVKPDSPALKLGFENFDMNSFGLTKEYSNTWS